MNVVSSPPAHPEISLDTDQLRADVEAPDINEHLATSIDLSQSLGFSGTLSFVIGDL
jgi:2-hydroxychromene-2-carboxylate isomerase